MIIPLITLVIPTKNEECNLPRLFLSLKALDYPKNRFEVIIVDGYSTDKTVEIAKKYGAKVLNNPKKIRGAGCQIGIDQAKGKLVAFTDADCVVPKNWLGGLAKYLEKDNKIAAVGGPNVTPKDDTFFSKTAGDVLWLLTRAGARYGFKSNKEIETYHNPGCNVLYKKEALDKAGGFNLGLLTCEDEELDFRLLKKGYRLLFAPEVSVDHYRRPTYKKLLIQSFRYASGRMQAIKLHKGMARWFHFVPSLIWITIGFALISLFNIDLRYFGIAYLLAMFDSFLAVSILLSIIFKNSPFYVYLLILFCWFGGWGTGFIYGLRRTN
ncbi:MAG: glycosyltransferase [bacterium]|nr:glycosyltransferase [bacterium]